MAGGLEPDDPEGPFQPWPFYDSMILLVLVCLTYFLLSSVWPAQTLTSAAFCQRSTPQNISNCIDSCFFFSP